MKTRHLIYLLLSVCLSYACTNDDLNIPEVNEQKTEVKEEVSLKAAKDLLEDFVGETYSRSVNSFKIKSHRIRTVHVNNIGGLPSKAKEAIPVYEFVTETDGKEGYSVVVSDERVDKVLISVPYGSLADTTFIEPLRLYYQDIPLLIEQDLEQYNKGTQETATLSRMTVENVYRFLSTTWGTSEPYNALYPAYLDPSCAAVAAAQILAYHRKPTNLDWTAILDSPSITLSSSTQVINQVSTLIRDLDVAMNVSLDGGVNESYIIPALRTYGLQCSGMINFSIQDGKYSLENGGPFLLGAQGTTLGHLWVCDGWKRHIYDDNTYYDYLSMNWGWSGNSNGFYYVENPMSFSANGYLFNSSFRMSNNLR
ncbi:MAG: C10 family peptidase [Bacteroidaceae bacterium]|nr:C10 family peptidase [Bacteroidaceae bacterium]